MPARIRKAFESFMDPTRGSAQCSPRDARLALFITDMTGGGAERNTLRLASRLSLLGFPVDLVLSRAIGEFLDQVPEHVRVVNLNAWHPLASWVPLIGYLRRERPVALLSALTQPNIAAVWAKKLSGSTVRVIVGIRNTLSMEAGKNSSSLKQKLLPFFVRSFARLADTAVCVSHGAARDYQKLTGVSQDRIEVIYNPVISAELFQKSMQPVDHPWFQEGCPPVILAVGRLDVQKDFPTLLRAFAKVKDRYTQPLRLVILGEGELRSELEALIQELKLSDHVALPGFSNNPYAYMRRARLFVLSSLWEGLPTVLIEALACGLPVVSTDCPSGPEEILQHGKYGALVPVGDADRLAEAIASALLTEKRPVAEECLQPFQSDRVIVSYVKLLTGKDVSEFDLNLPAGPAPVPVTASVEKSAS